MFWVLKSNLAKRILLLVSVSILLMLAAFVLSGWLAITQMSQRVLHERQALADAIRSHLDYVLAQNLGRLENFRFAPGVDLTDENLQPEVSALHDLYLQADFDDGVFLTDENGSILWSEPAGASYVGLNLQGFPPAAQVLNTGRSTVTGPLHGELMGRESVLFITPVHSREGRMAGLVAGWMSPDGPVLRGVADWVNSPDSTYVAIVDNEGSAVVAAGTDDSGQSSQRDVTVRSDLTYVPWTVIIRQSGANAAAPVRDMQVRLISFGVFSILFVLGLSWGMARSILKPLAELKDAAQTISRGDLTQPIPHASHDEIGELSRSFDGMRMELKRSLQQIQQWNQDLETKVRERTQQLEDSYREIERKEEARGELLRKLFSAQEEERRRIARELHDETSQTLNSLVMRLEAALAAPDDAPGRIKSILKDSRDLAVHTVDSVHKIIFDLRPAVLDDLGLTSALRWYSQNRLKECGVNVRVEVTGEERKLPATLENAVFRVVQEAVNNIARHAEAQNALLSIEFGDQSVSIEIEDDGRGFDAGDFSLCNNRVQGLGLAGMAERVSLVGGNLKIDSQPGAGTHIYITIPL